MGNPEAIFQTDGSSRSGGRRVVVAGGRAGRGTLGEEEGGFFLK